MLSTNRFRLFERNELRRGLYLTCMNVTASYFSKKQSIFSNIFLFNLPVLPAFLFRLLP